MPTPTQVVKFNVDKFSKDMLSELDNSAAYWVTKLSLYKTLIDEIDAAYNLNITNLSIFSNLVFTATPQLLKTRLVRLQGAFNQNDLEKEVLGQINDPQAKALFNLATDAVLTRIRLFLDNKLDHQPKPKEDSLATKAVKNSIHAQIPTQRTPLAPVDDSNPQPVSPSASHRGVRVFG